MRSVLYRFPDLAEFDRMVSGACDEECELGLPSGEVVEDGEWVLAIFEVGSGRRATSTAGRGLDAPDGPRLVFEPRDWRRLLDFARSGAHRPLSIPPTDPTPRFLLPELRDETAPETQPETELEEVEAEVEPSPDTARSRADVRPSGRGARVLIVDDDPDIRDVVAAMLEAVDLVVTPVGSAEEALDRLHIERFDLVVLDWNLPQMTGLELCRLLRKEPDCAALPVLFLTANASSQDMVEGFACGGDDYVVKPFRAPELGARIFSLLRRARR